MLVGYFFELDEENNLFRFTWEGQFTDKIFLEAVGKQRRALASRSGSRCIHDLSGVVGSEVSSDAIRTAAKTPAQGEEKSVVVLVARSDFLFGLARMFTMLTEEARPNRHVVRTVEEAYDILGVKDPQFKPIFLP